jgi:hypothetical protein
MYASCGFPNLEGVLLVSTKDPQTMEFVNVAYRDLSSSSDISGVLDTNRSLVRREVMRDFRRKERQRKMIGTFTAAKREHPSSSQLTGYD